MRLEEVSFGRTWTGSVPWGWNAGWIKARLKSCFRSDTRDTGFLMGIKKIALLFWSFAVVGVGVGHGTLFS
jgi:hypothetical protein